MDLTYEATKTFSMVHRDPNRYIFCRGPVGCMPANTEILTPTGWVRIDSWDGQEIAQWDSSSENISFVIPDKYIKLPCEEFIQFNNRHSMSMVLSDEHRMPLYNWQGAFVVKQACEIEKHPSRYRVPINYILDSDGLDLTDDEIVEYININGEDSEDAEYKYFKKYWWKANSRQLSIIINTIKSWYTSDNFYYKTLHKEDAEFIQHAAHASGYSTEFLLDADNLFYTVNISKTNLCIDDNTEISRVKSEDGFKYCFSVPTSFFVARHNGKIFITGNSGKSSGCIWHCFLNALQQKPDARGVRNPHYGVIRASYPTLKSTTIKSWLSWFGPLIKIVYDTPIRGSINMPLPDGTHLNMDLTFLALDREEEVSKLQSLELTGAHVNEASDIPLSIIQMLKTRINRWPKADLGGATQPFIICDYNSVDTEHELYKLAEVDRPEGYSFYHQPPAVLMVGKGEGVVKDLEGNEYIINPEAENVDPLGKKGVSPQYYLDSIIGAEPDWINVFLMNNYGLTKAGKLVYPMYNDGMHVHDITPQKGVPIIVGLDCGLCYTPDHDVLTSNGWKNITEVDIEKDLIATRNDITKELEYQKSSRKLVKEYNGTIIDWNTQNFSFAVTEDHIIPYENRDTPGIVRRKSAKELVRTCTGHHFVNATSIWKGRELTKEELPLNLDPITYAKFMGWYLSEGNIDSPVCKKVTNRVYISQKTEENIQRIKDVLNNIPIKWSYYKGNFRFSNKELADYLKQFGKSHEKYIPNEIKFATKEIIYHFLEAYTLGDGAVRLRKNGSIEHTITTKSKRMSDDLQEIAQKFGINSYISKSSPTKSWYAKEQRYICGESCYVVSFRSTAKRYELLGNNNGKERIKEYNYSGKVYCLTVPNGTLFIRRNGVAHWNGNCPAAVFTQLTPTGQFIVFDEIATEDCSVQEFAEELLRPKLLNEYRDFQYLCVVDPAAVKRVETDARCAYDMLKGAGLNVKTAKTNNFFPRKESVTYFLRRIHGFTLDPKCVMLRKGFVSGYCYDKIRGANSAMYKDSPTKNEYSHPHDALQYAALEVVGNNLTHKTRRSAVPTNSIKIADRVAGY